MNRIGGIEMIEFGEWNGFSALNAKKSMDAQREWRSGKNKQWNKAIDDWDWIVTGLF